MSCFVWFVLHIQNFHYFFYNSIAEHSKLLTGASRYKSVVGETDYKKTCQAIQLAEYVTKLIKLIEDNNLTQFNKETVAIKEDAELGSAVSKIIHASINLNYNHWKCTDLIKLNNVPVLLTELGGLDNLVVDKVISDKQLWLTKQYNANHVRSLLIKYASKLA